MVVLALASCKKEDNEPSSGSGNGGGGNPSGPITSTELSFTLSGGGIIDGAFSATSTTPALDGVVGILGFTLTPGLTDEGVTSWSGTGPTNDGQHYIQIIAGVESIDNGTFTADPQNSTITDIGLVIFTNNAGGPGEIVDALECNLATLTQSQMDLDFMGTGNNSGRLTFSGEFQSTVDDTVIQVTNGVLQVQPLF